MNLNLLATVPTAVLERELLRRAIERSKHRIKLQEEALENLHDKLSSQYAEHEYAELRRQSTINSKTINPKTK